MKTSIQITENKTTRQIPLCCESQMVRTDMLVLSDGCVMPLLDVVFALRKLNESVQMEDYDPGILESDVPDPAVFPFLMQLGNFLTPVKQAGGEELYYYVITNMNRYLEVAAQVQKLDKKRKEQALKADDLEDILDHCGGMDMKTYTTSIYNIRDIHGFLSDISIPMVLLNGVSYPIYQIEQTILLLNKATYPIGADNGIWETDFPSTALVDALCDKDLLTKQPVSNPVVFFYKIKNHDAWIEFIEDIRVIMEAFHYELHIG